jgi:transcriptional regulator with XRE-family HTH domain
LEMTIVATQSGKTQRHTDVNVVALQRAMIQCQEDLGCGSLTEALKVVAQDTGIGVSTLFRISRCEGVPDAETIARLARWLDVPITRFVGQGQDGRTDGAISYLPHESTPQVVDALLFADETLNAEQAAHVSKLFRIAYGLAPKENGNGNKKK